MPSGTNTDVPIYSLRRAIPLVVDSVPADDAFNTLMDALHGVGQAHSDCGFIHPTPMTLKTFSGAV